jgi:hypothetical protein
MNPVERFLEDRSRRMGTIGRKGGQSKSERKLAAVKENLKKAQARRWPGRPHVKD